MSSTWQLNVVDAWGFGVGCSWNSWNFLTKRLVAWKFLTSKTVRWDFSTQVSLVVRGNFWSLVSCSIVINLLSFILMNLWLLISWHIDILVMKNLLLSVRFDFLIFESLNLWHSWSLVRRNFWSIVSANLWSVRGLVSR